LPHHSFQLCHGHPGRVFYPSGHSISERYNSTYGFIGGRAYRMPGFLRQMTGSLVVLHLVGSNSDSIHTLRIDRKIKGPDYKSTAKMAVARLHAHASVEHGT
jgi:hypothetical protein